jgi:predicted transcriptional regulator
VEESIRPKKQKTSKAVSPPPPPAPSQRKKSAVAKALAETDAGDLLVYMKTGLVSVNTTDPLLTVLSVLVENKISGAAVYDPEAKKHVAFVDAVDIMTVTMKLLEGVGELKAGPPKEPVEEDVSMQSKHLREEVLVADLKARTIADFSKRDPFVLLDYKKSALMAAELLSKPDVHRIGLVNEEGRLLGLVTQCQMAQYLFEEHSDLIHKIDVKVSSLALPIAVAKVREDEPAMLAFQHMAATRVSGLAVVNKAGVLVDAISKTDLTLWNEWVAGGVPLRFFSAEKLHEPVTSYLQSARPQLGLPNRGRVLSCRPDESVEKVLEPMIENNVHRLFVVDHIGVPVSIITYGDILALYVKPPSA